jgi:YesN/AraC family two-component response regulator
MTPEVMEHAFDLFFQGHLETFKGTGLGLALSKELMSLHKGTIRIESEKWKGTTFEIVLPLGKDHLEPGAFVGKPEFTPTIFEEVELASNGLYSDAAEQEEAAPPPTASSILIIEDHPDMRQFLQSRLRGSFEVHQADNGIMGLQLAYEIVPDLIICDIILPGKDGMNLVQTLKNDIRTSHIPVILLTAVSNIERQIEGLRIKADAFITKPFNLQYLEESIRNLLKKQELLRDHFLSELQAEKRAPLAKKIDRKFVNEFVALVESNVANENFGVDEICREIGISKVQLYRKIKSLLGYNVNEYILHVRLQKAKYLMAKEDLTIAEIAFKVGFSSQAYFSTVFKSNFAMTPSEYKEKMKA